MLKEDLSTLLKENNTPALVLSEEMTLEEMLKTTVVINVKVEKCQICTKNDFIHAYMVVFASYYTFNLAYNPKLCATLTFVQKFLLDIGDKVKPITKVLSLISNLKKL